MSYTTLVTHCSAAMVSQQSATFNPCILFNINVNIVHIYIFYIILSTWTASLHTEMNYIYLLRCTVRILAIDPLPMSTKITHHIRKWMSTGRLRFVCKLFASPVLYNRARASSIRAYDFIVSLELLLLAFLCWDIMNLMNSGWYLFMLAVCHTCQRKSGWFYYLTFHWVWQNLVYVGWEAIKLRRFFFLVLSLYINQKICA